ncbi:MAG TPA: formate dehydrogenase N subunit beta transmembrane domain-containing protein, partial [Deltaproteobacteria bacterium]|nr:formate dehydrogenase N subunit beta transmembrane domain-containing protein [Deltaproteobacteria bacterium]
LIKMNYFAGVGGSIPGALFAEKLIEKMPGMSRVYYTNSGSEANEKVYKCDLCYTRLMAGEKPACVLSCPTGALTIGEKDAMIKKAYDRVKELGGDANVYGDKFVKSTHVIYVLTEKPEVYDELPTNPSVPFSVILWKNLFKPFTLIGLGAVAGMAGLHYLIKGPHKIHEEKEGGQ